MDKKLLYPILAEVDSNKIYLFNIFNKTLNKYILIKLNVVVSLVKIKTYTS